jgi:hypothetical protein
MNLYPHGIGPDGDHQHAVPIRTDDALRDGPFTLWTRKPALLSADMSKSVYDTQRERERWQRWNSSGQRAVYLGLSHHFLRHPDGRTTVVPGAFR